MTERKEHTCSIEGCNKPRLSRGWCEGHYTRFRKHGDPLGGGTSKGAPLAFLENTVLPYDGEECLIWPYTKSGDGYGRVKRDGKIHSVNRIVCEAEHGPPPTPEHQAAHNCGKGHLGCCNHHHLQWKTPKENNADKLLHGTHNRGERHNFAKLTEADVLHIRASAKTQKQLAAEYGVTQGNISHIKAGRNWSWAGDANVNAEGNEMTKPLKLDDLAAALWKFKYGAICAFERLPDKSKDDARAEARAILTTIKQSGYAIVPVEADEATIRAVDKACHEHWPNARRMAVAMHAAMLSAAPVIEGE